MTTISSGTDAFVFSEEQKGGVDFNSVCSTVAEQLHLPEAFIAYMLFEKLYQLGPRQAISFFIDSALVRYLYNNRGKFEIEQVRDHIQVRFEDNTSIGQQDADMTWADFFELGYINCNEAQLAKVNKALAQQLLNAVDRYDN